MRKTRWALAWVAVVAISLPLALAQGRGGHGRQPEGAGMMFHAISRLDLSETQRDAVHALAEEFRPRLEESQEIVEELKAELRGIVEESGFDEAQLRPTVEAQSGAMAELSLLKLELHSKIRSVLTAEQLETLKEMRGSRGQGHGHGQGRQNRKR